MDILDLKDLVTRRLSKEIRSHIVQSIYAAVSRDMTTLYVVLYDDVKDDNHNLGRRFVTMFEDIPKLTVTTHYSYAYFHRFNHLLIYNSTAS